MWLFFVPFGCFFSVIILLEKFDLWNMLGFLIKLLSSYHLNHFLFTTLVHHVNPILVLKRTFSVFFSSFFYWRKKSCLGIIIQFTNSLKVSFPQNANFDLQILITSLTLFAKCGYYITLHINLPFDLWFMTFHILTIE